VRIETLDGRVPQSSHHGGARQPAGANPMERQEVEAKALDLTAPVLGRGNARGELIETIGNLEAVWRRLTSLRGLLQAVGWGIVRSLG